MKNARVLLTALAIVTTVTAGLAFKTVSGNGDFSCRPASSTNPDDCSIDKDYVKDGSTQMLCGNNNGDCRTAPFLTFVDYNE